MIFKVKITYINEITLSISTAYVDSIYYHYTNQHIMRAYNTAAQTFLLICHQR